MSTAGHEKAKIISFIENFFETDITIFKFHCCKIVEITKPKYFQKNKRHGRIYKGSLRKTSKIQLISRVAKMPVLITNKNIS